MSIIAERAYNSTRTNKTNKSESAEDKAYRLSREYNSIFRMIEKVNDAKTFVQCRNAIASYGHEAGKNSLDVMKLTEKLNARIKTIAHDTQQNIDRISAEIDKIKNEKFEEPVEILQELNAQAEHRLLQFMMCIALQCRWGQTTITIQETVDVLETGLYRLTVRMPLR